MFGVLCPVEVIFSAYRTLLAPSRFSLNASLQRSRDELAQSTLIKDTMRDTNTTRDIFELFYVILTNYSESARELCLSTLEAMKVERILIEFGVITVAGWWINLFLASGALYPLS